MTAAGFDLPDSARTRAENAGPAPSTRRLIEIEALRGVAIIMVLLEHMPLNLLACSGRSYHLLFDRWHGTPGVDLFFAISGFVITRSLAPDLLTAHKRHHWRIIVAFWLRRIWRLTPTAWLWVAIPLLLSLTLNRTNAFNPFWQDLAPAVAALLNFSNVYVAMFWPAHIAGITSPYWSLSLEEQFYFLFPLAALLFRRNLIVLMATLLVYQFVLPYTVLAILTRPGSIAAGVALALLRDTDRYRAAAPQFMASRFWPHALVLIAWTAVAGAMLGERLVVPNGVRWGFVAVFSGAAVFAASFDRDYVLAQGIARHLLAWFGTRSYSLYLVHMPMFALTRELVSRANVNVGSQDVQTAALLVAAAGLIILTTAELTYRYVETPSRQRGAQIAKNYLGSTFQRSQPNASPPISSEESRDLYPYVNKSSNEGRLIHSTREDNL